MYEYEVEWAYRSLTARYDGTKTIRTNYEDIEESTRIAKRRIASDLCTEPSMIDIQRIRRVN